MSVKVSSSQTCVNLNESVGIKHPQSWKASSRERDTSSLASSSELMSSMRLSSWNKRCRSCILDLEPCDVVLLRLSERLRGLPIKESMIGFKKIVPLPAKTLCAGLTRWTYKNYLYAEKRGETCWQDTVWFDRSSGLSCLFCRHGSPSLYSDHLKDENVSFFFGPSDFFSCWLVHTDHDAKLWVQSNLCWCCLLSGRVLSVLAAMKYSTAADLGMWAIPVWTIIAGMWKFVFEALRALEADLPSLWVMLK